MLPGAIRDLSALLCQLEPMRNEGVHVYAWVPHGTPTEGIPHMAAIREPGGVTLITGEADAIERGLPIVYRAAWITLKVHSDLDAVGLTAAVAGVLAEADISCNVVAGAFHDHLFVPVAKADEAMRRLRSLQQVGSCERLPSFDHVP